MQGLKNIKENALKNNLERVQNYPKGKRGGFGMTRGISDCGYEMWGDSLYDYKIYDACHAVEKYYNRELE